MRAIAGLIGGVVAGAVGGGIWAAISHYGQVEIGWIAWGIGGLVGLGVAVGGGGKLGALGGIIAVVLSVAAIAGGKYAALQWDVSTAASDPEYLEIIDNRSDEFLITWIADEIAADAEENGAELDWPTPDPDERMTEADYPPDIWSQAAAQWDTMSEEERATLRETVRDIEIRAYQAFLDEYAAGQGFIDSFSLFDALWIFLAVATAWQIASSERQEEAGSAHETPPETPQA